MSDQIGPALSPEEWKAAQYGAVYYAGQPNEDRYRHSVAALALHGQPFGFTWDDVRMLEDLDRPDLASRIAALLPPKRG